MRGNATRSLISLVLSAAYAALLVLVARRLRRRRSA